MINFRRTFAWLFAPAQAPPEGLLPFVRVTHNAPGLEDKLPLVPVVVVDVGAVEALDHLGGAGAGFDGLEDAEGNEGAAANLCLRHLARVLLDHLCPTCARLLCHCRAHAITLSFIQPWVAKQDATWRWSNTRVKTSPTT